jgi:hypothetical protein
MSKSLDAVDRVIAICKHEPMAANSDSVLIARFWQSENFNKMYMDHGLVFALERVTRPETITRARRRAHEAGLIQYSDKADAERYKAHKRESEAANSLSHIFGDPFNQIDRLIPKEGKFNHD